MLYGVILLLAYLELPIVTEIARQLLMIGREYSLLILENITSIYLYLATYLIMFRRARDIGNGLVAVQVSLALLTTCSILSPSSMMLMVSFIYFCFCFIPANNVENNYGAVTKKRILNRNDKILLGIFFTITFLIVGALIIESINR